jgi:hypothetical protein
MSLAEQHKVRQRSPLEESGDEDDDWQPKKKPKKLKKDDENETKPDLKKGKNDKPIKHDKFAVIQKTMVKTQMVPKLEVTSAPCATIAPPPRALMLSRIPHPTAIVWIAFASKENLQQLLKCTRGFFDSAKNPISFEFIVHPKTTEPGDFDCLRVSFTTLNKSVWAKLQASIHFKEPEQKEEKSFTVPLSVFAKIIETIDQSMGVVLWMAEGEENLCVESVRSAGSRRYNHEVSYIKTQDQENTEEFDMPLDPNYTVEFVMSEFKSLIAKSQSHKSEWIRIVLLRSKVRPDQSYIVFQFKNDRALLVEYSFLGYIDKGRKGIIVFRDQVLDEAEDAQDEKVMQNSVEILVDALFLTDNLHKFGTHISCTNVQLQFKSGVLLMKVQFEEDPSFMMFCLPAKEIDLKETREEIRLLQ